MYPATTKYTVSLLNPKDLLESDFWTQHFLGVLLFYVSSSVPQLIDAIKDEIVENTLNVDKC